MNIDIIFRNLVKCKKKKKKKKKKKIGGIHLNTCILATEGPKEPKLKSND